MRWLCFAPLAAGSALRLEKRGGPFYDAENFGDNSDRYASGKNYDRDQYGSSRYYASGHGGGGDGYGYSRSSTVRDGSSRYNGDFFDPQKRSFRVEKLKIIGDFTANLILKSHFAIKFVSKGGSGHGAHNRTDPQHRGNGALHA